ncbi:MAG TPA: hypothetical protein VMB27_03265 [Solirubrobacteraceae bacterium]|nr:hypothetical protein [Solirubrobacteraceae bacterium]
MIVLVAVAGLLAAAATSPARPPVLRDSVTIQAVFDSHGNPSLVANSGGAGPPPRWSICAPPPAAGCVQTKKTRFPFLNPGPEPAGTVFVATETVGGLTYRASVTWQGRVTPVTPPRVVGRPRFRGHVTAIAGRWTGGWGTESDQLGVEACRTRRGSGCVVLSGGQLGCPGQPARAFVGGWLPGMYLFAFDARTPRDWACAGVGYSYPGAVRPWPVQQIVARSAPAGPVKGPPRPTVAILQHSFERAGRVVVADVHCVAVCRVTVNVFDGRSSSGARLTFRGSASVGVPRRMLRAGPLTVSMHVDDGPTIGGESRLA